MAVLAVAAVVVVVWSSLAAHEAGHVLAARLLGHHVERVQVGVGLRLVGRRLRSGVTVEVRAVPAGGQTVLTPPLRPWDRVGAAGRLVVVLAGPAVNLAVVGGLLATGAVAPGELVAVPDLHAGLAVAVVQALATVNLLVGVGNLLPLPPADGAWAVAAATSLVAGRVGDGTTATATRTAVQLAALGGVLVAARAAGALLP